MNGLNVSSLAGYTVTSIDGKPALEALQNYADSVGGYKDPSTRFNAALQSYIFSTRLKQKDGSFTIRSRIPLAGSVAYRLKAPNGGAVVDVSLPWLTVMSETVFKSLARGAAAYYDDYCSVAVNASKRDDADQTGVEVEERQDNFLEKGVEVDDISARDDISFPQLVASSKENGLYQLDSTTGLWTVSHFRSKDANVSMVEHSKKGLMMLERLGVTNLIIDVSGNGGGVVDYGQELVQFLFPTSQIDFLTFETLYTPAKAYLENVFTAESSSGQSSVHQDAYALTFMTNPVSLEVVNTTSQLYTYGRRESRGNGQTLYSSRFQYAVNETLTEKQLPTVSLKRGWSSQNILILSNGICGSTCGQFVRTLRDSIGVKSYTYGSPTRVAFQPTAFEAGAVMKAESIIPNASFVQSLSASVSTASFPRPFPLAVSSSMAWWAAFNTHASPPTVPLEYFKSVSDGYIEVSNPLDAFEVWGKAAALMKGVSSEPSVGNLQAIRPLPPFNPSSSTSSTVSKGTIILATLLVIFILAGLSAIAYLVYRMYWAPRQQKSSNKLPKLTITSNLENLRIIDYPESARTPTSAMTPVGNRAAGSKLTINSGMAKLMNVDGPESARTPISAKTPMSAKNFYKFR
jgi:hypothetical protein